MIIPEQAAAILYFAMLALGVVAWVCDWRFRKSINDPFTPTKVAQRWLHRFGASMTLFVLVALIIVIIEIIKFVQPASSFK